MQVNDFCVCRKVKVSVFYLLKHLTINFCSVYEQRLNVLFMLLKLWQKPINALNASKKRKSIKKVPKGTSLVFQHKSCTIRY